MPGRLTAGQTSGSAPSLYFLNATEADRGLELQVRLQLIAGSPEVSLRVRHDQAPECGGSSSSGADLAVSTSAADGTWTVPNSASNPASLGWYV